MTTITLLHTSDAHVPTFQALQTRLAPDCTLVQIVRSDWLAQAQHHGLSDPLRQEIADIVKEARGTVICTCTTIGPAAVDAGAIRVDAPMMERAAITGGTVLLAYALESTKDTSTELLKSALAAQGQDQDIRHLFCGTLWPLFTAGEFAAFVNGIAKAVERAILENDVDCVVLAQASMADAAPLLSHLNVPVFASPESAMLFALERKTI
ncbi:hypothetical protein SAMN05444000_10982 [Shimia gijangensis]|uniref:Arylsulfatase n=1 Tax=Shimia gijangensis TaxID=1470563 RepID=A0A1M6JPL4_9RHOB|nr:hypothetical protein [Shimia gijangensis]SHJ48610.1 hypothetical protein SAMN05444000_10982 [Shimia gijangensis]